MQFFNPIRIVDEDLKKEEFIQSFLDMMTDSLSSGERLEFRDFGVFEVVLRKQKVGRNPKDADVPIIIPARNAVKFTPGKKMRTLIEGTTVTTSYSSSTSSSTNTSTVKVTSK